MEWFFDGIGSQIIGIIISLIIGGIGGGAVGYRIGVKKTSKQKQIAGDESQQKQSFRICADDNETASAKKEVTIKQSQKAGNNSVQSQIGGINDDRR